MTDDVLGLPPGRWIVGHRGAAGEAPENTLDSLLLAVEQGADMIECDLQLTADEWLVLAHDRDFARMGDDPTRVEESRLEELDGIEVSGPFRTNDRRRRVATLHEVLALLPFDMPLNLELKRRDADAEAMASSLAGAIVDRSRILVSSFDWPLLERVRDLLPTLPLAPLGGRTVDRAQLLATAADIGAWSIHCRHSVADRRLIEQASSDGRPVLVYTVNDSSKAERLFDRGVRGVFSDHPGRLRRDLTSTHE